MFDEKMTGENHMLLMIKRWTFDENEKWSMFDEKMINVWW